MAQQVYYREAMREGIGWRKRWTIECSNCGTAVTFDSLNTTNSCLGCGEDYVLVVHRPPINDKAMAYLMARAKVGGSNFYGFSVEEQLIWQERIEALGLETVKQWIDNRFSAGKRGAGLAYSVYHILKKSSGPPPERGSLPEEESGTNPYSDSW